VKPVSAVERPALGSNAIACGQAGAAKLVAGRRRAIARSEPAKDDERMVDVLSRRGL
jgi:hypothetical protein